MTPERITSTAKELAALLARSDGEREVIEAAPMSVAIAMERFAPHARAELQALVDAFIADPRDKETIQTTRALLRDARS